MKTKFLAVLTFISAGFIAGCGGSGTSTPAASTMSSTTSISGKVADGYLAGATVFMDKNSNYQLDPGEPSATSDANGAYTLTVDPADVGKYPIVAIAIKGVTVDNDTNTPVTSTYVLSMPATAISGTVNSNFISPMSSQLRIMMDTGNYASMQDAMNALSTKLSLPAGTNMMTDYMAANNTVMHTAAQNMATLMGSQMTQVLNTNGSTTTVDVGRYQGMMVAIFKNMSSIKGSNSSAQSAMTNLMGTMTTTLQGSPSGLPFSNISSAIRGMMGGKGSSIIGDMMGGTSSSTAIGTGAGTTIGTGGMMVGTTTPSTTTGTGVGTTAATGSMMK